MQKGSEKQSLSRYRDSSLYTREPLVLCIFRGMGFALCLCNTKAKLAKKQNDKHEFVEMRK